MKNLKKAGYTIVLTLILSCSKNDIPAQTPPVTDSPAGSLGNVAVWLTKGNQSALFSRQDDLTFKKANSNTTGIQVDSTRQFQQIDGFGFCLTDGSAKLLHQMSESKREALLQELFSTTDSSIGISYIRVSIGASDLSDSTYSYDDMPPGQTDKALSHFSIDKAKTELIPTLQEILHIAPDLKILGSPWSAPAWMKDNHQTKGGSLLPAYYKAYAAYFVRYIQDMQAAGISIDAITPQNEPLNPDNNPSMFMDANAQAGFIKNALGPAFETAGLTTDIIIYDHNADRPDYPLDILKDPQAAKYIDGSAFHLYAGKIEALSDVHKAFPKKNIYFTEQYTPSTGSFMGDLSWHINNLIIGATRNWSRNVIEWNLAADSNLGPHTPGGCTTCLGALTIMGDEVSRNPSYYIIAHAAKFVRPGSHRILSTELNHVRSVAFITPKGQKVLIALNTSPEVQNFSILYGGKVAAASLSPGAVATYVWN